MNCRNRCLMFVSQQDRVCNCDSRGLFSLNEMNYATANKQNLFFARKLISRFVETRQFIFYSVSCYKSHFDISRFSEISIETDRRVEKR